VEYGDGWMPTGRDPEALRAPIAELVERMAEADRPAPEISLLTPLPVDEGLAVALERARAFAEVGVTRIVHAQRYRDAAELREIAELLVDEVRPAAAASV